MKGTEGISGFGLLRLNEIRRTQIEQWKVSISSLINQKRYAPTTANGWFSIFCVIMRAAAIEFEFPSPVEGVKPFDTSEWQTYTEEEPNSLTADEVPMFLMAVKAMHPQHYAMTYLGLATGLRPSTLRPLRRSGDTPDVVWDDNVLFVRRSQTMGDEVMNTTKNKRRYRISVPAEVMDVLRWHVETQLETPGQKASELLFPREDGGFRTASILNKPFANVAEEIELKKKFTQRGMRRTFNDLARNAKVERLITKSISGHVTDCMVDHYSSIAPQEQRECIGRIAALFVSKKPSEKSGPSGGPTANEVDLQKQKTG